jgi:hypothetical protein
MSVKTRSALITQAGVIKNEVATGANTATRVGTMHEDTIDSMSMRVLLLKTVSTTTYTLLEADSGTIILYTNASGCAVTIPDTLSVGHNCLHIQKGAAQVSFTGSGTMTIVNADSHDKTNKLNAVTATIIESSTVCNLNGYTGA